METKNVVLLTTSEKVEDDDDDCVILEGNPFAPTLINNPNITQAGSDDLIIVRDSGEIACRDYPHARHLCATLPFASTSHFKHCRQCHCYVCDSLAPCASWGPGTSVNDHCHATDKEQTWKAKRNCHRLGRNSSTHIPQSPIIPRSVRLSIGAQYCNHPQSSLPYQTYDQNPDYTNPSYSVPQHSYASQNDVNPQYNNPVISKACYGNGSQGCTNPPYSLLHQNYGFQGGKNSPYTSRDYAAYYGSEDLYIDPRYNLVNGSQGYMNSSFRQPDYIYGSQGYTNAACNLPNYSYGTQDYSTNHPC